MPNDPLWWLPAAGLAAAGVPAAAVTATGVTAERPVTCPLAGL
jgi:hypothetical protein